MPRGILPSRNEVRVRREGWSREKHRWPTTSVCTEEIGRGCASRTRESSCFPVVSNPNGGWPCYAISMKRFAEAVHLPFNVGQSCREHAFRRVIELKVPWLATITRHRCRADCRSNKTMNLCKFFEAGRVTNFDEIKEAEK